MASERTGNVCPDLVLDPNKRVKKEKEAEDWGEGEHGYAENGEGCEVLKHKRCTTSQVTSMVQASSSQEASSCAPGEGVTPNTAHLWDRSNTQQWDIVSLSAQYKNLLKNKLSELTENVHFSPLIPHLLQLGVIDKQIRETIQLNDTEATKVLRLVDHLEKGPCWRLHGFLRALELTEQQHIIKLVGLKPTDYEAVEKSCHPTPVTDSASQSKQKPHFYKRSESEEFLQISRDLLPGLLQHCGAYNRTLLKSSLFGYKRTDPIDLMKIYISPNLECKEYSSTFKPIGKMEMFLMLFQRDPPNTVSLEGPAGAGKSSIMQDYAYQWSKDITSCEERGIEAPCEGHLWKLVLYIPLGSIRGISFEDAIQANLMCKPDLKEDMMAEMNIDGEGVLIIGDGIDELQDQTAIEGLHDYTRISQTTKQKPKFLITARDGLLHIPREHFDRELHIKGFTLEQGMQYMEQYFKVMYEITEHPVLDYTRTHQAELGWVLKNPLQVHILSEVTASGFLTLDDVKTLRTVKLFRTLDYLMVTRDEESRGVGADSSDFYTVCMRCLLNSKRQITEEEIGSGSPYLSLLTKYTYRDQDYKLHHTYGFPHEMVFEFFAMRGLVSHIKSHPENRKALLLYLCSNRNMWNVLRLTCGFITQYQRELFPDTVVAIVRCCLLLQTQIEPCVKNELTKELPTLDTQIQECFPRHLLSCGLTTEQMTKMDRMFDLIQGMFSQPDDCLKKCGWAPTSAKHQFWSERNPFHIFILTCLEQCTPEERTEMYRTTAQQLLPCAAHDHQLEYNRFVVPISARLTTGNLMQKNTKLEINILCPLDLLPTLQSPKQLCQIQQTDTCYTKLQTQITKLNLSDQYDVIQLSVNCTMQDLCGLVATGGWSEEEWTPGLTQLMLQYDMSYIRICVAHHAPLSGLLSACREVITRGHKLTQGLVIMYGKVAEEDLLQFYHWAYDVGLAVELRWMTVVLAAGRDPEEWEDLDSVIRDSADIVRGQWYGNVCLITYVSASGQVLCENYTGY